MTLTAAPPAPTRESTSRTLPGPRPVHYHRAGSGPGLLLLHGSGPGVSGWANFGGTLAAFADRYTVVVPDLPGYGSSYVPDLDDTDYVAAVTEAVLAVLDAEGLDRVDVVGNSLGGMLTAALAIAHPDRFRRLVMMGPGGIAPPLLAPLPSEGIKLLLAFNENPTRENLVRWMQAMVGDQSFLTEERIEDRWRTASAPGALDFNREFYRRAFRPRPNPGVPIWAQLGRIGHPTLLTFGRDDRVTPLETALHPLRNIRNAELHVFPNCGHWAMQERKEEFERVVAEFLDRPGD